MITSVVGSQKAADGVQEGGVLVLVVVVCFLPKSRQKLKGQ